MNSKSLIKGALALALSTCLMPVEAREEGSLRIATFNTYLLSNKFRCLQFRKETSALTPVEIDPIGKVDCALENSDLPFFETKDTLRQQADEIVKAIKSLGDSVDVIVLNEVWDETAKERLSAHLAAQFPNQVKMIDGAVDISDPTLLKLVADGNPGAVFKGEDSGLMLFARRNVKFLPFRGPARPAGTTLTAVASTYNAARAHTFLHAKGEDSLAAKAVGAVHVELTVGGVKARAYVLFTHTQADDENAGTRKRQLREIETFIRTNVIDPKGVESEERSKIMLLGDINVRGEGELIPVMAGTTPKAEWKERFTVNTPGPALGDSWARGNSDKYVGATYEYGQGIDQRLDYLLVKQGTPATGYCVQHSRVMLQDAPSDHNAVVTDLNAVFPFCAPRAAGLPPFDQHFSPSAGPIADATAIATPGAMQWFRFPGKSAATIDVVMPLNGVRPHMFPAADLSQEISPKETSVRRQTTWSVPEDLFIQVRADSRTFTGDYSIRFNKRLCLSATAPCYLTPTLPQFAAFPANGLLGTEDAAFFRVDIIEAPDSGAAQSIVVTLGNVPKSYPVSITNADNPSEVIKGETFTIVGRGTFITFPVVGTKNLLVTIRRDNDKATTRTVKAAWTNNLTRVDLHSLICHDETDGFWGSEAGQDEIAMQVNYDGITKRVPSNGYRSFDCNSTDDEDAAFVQTLRTLGPVTIKLFEDDDGSPDDGSGPQVINPVRTVLEEKRSAVRWNPFEDGDYEMFIDLRMGSSGLVPKP